MLKTAILVSTLLILTFANEEPLRKFLQGNKQFAADTYKQVANLQTENFLVCPFSAEIILGLAQNGAKGKTRKEIEKALHLTNDTNPVFKKLLSGLKSEDYTLTTANRIYIQDNFKVKSNFFKTGQEVFQSTTQNVDFAKSDETAAVINNWVSNQTNDKIQNLVDPETLSEDTVAVLVNALYFQATWRKNFKKTLTRKENFYKNGEVVEVETMKRIHHFWYSENADIDARLLKMPFKGGNSSMVVVLPNKKNGLKNLERKVGKVFGSTFTWELVDVALPKFKIETSVDFKRVLKKLGVRKAFTRGDFSGISGKRGELHISDVVQKNFIEVDENGVEAASATAVFYEPKSFLPPYGEMRKFVVDHPFMFYVVVNDIVIFTGRVVSPN